MLRRLPMTGLALPLLLVGAFVWTPAATAGFGIHHPQKAEKQQIEDLEKQWQSANLSSDVLVMDKMLSDDFVGIQWNGQVNTKAMQIDRLRSRTLVFKRLEVTDMKVRVAGNGSVAIVTGRADVDLQNEGADLSGTFRYTRVYQRQPSGAWKITNFEATPVSDEHHHHERATVAPPPPPTK